MDGLAGRVPRKGLDPSDDLDEGARPWPRSCLRQAQAVRFADNELVALS